MFAAYAVPRRRMFVGRLDIRAPEDVFASAEEIGKRRAEMPRSQAIDQAMIDWESSREAQDSRGLADAARSLVDATANFFRGRGVPLIAHDPLPPQFVAREVEAVRQLPPTAQAAVVAHLIDAFDPSAKPLVAQQFARHLDDRVVDAAPAIRARLPGGEGRPAASQWAPPREEEVQDANLQGASTAQSARAKVASAALLSGGPPGGSAAQEDCSLGCACDDACPANEKLTCRPHQKMYGDFSGEGYGKATRRGWLWDEHPIVKYGCYKCTSQSGKRCGFSGPGKPGTQDLYGVDSESRYIPDSGVFRTIPIGTSSFVIDPRRPNDYPPEMYEAIRKGIKSCRRAGTCPIDQPPFDPE